MITEHNVTDRQTHRRTQPFIAKDCWDWGLCMAMAVAVLASPVRGRAVYQRLETGDTLTLQTDFVAGQMGYITFCVQIINN